MDIYTLDATDKQGKSLLLFVILLGTFLLFMKMQSSLVGGLIFLQILWPIIVITLYEISLGKGNLITRFKQTSIGKTTNNYKNHIDDLWYMFFINLAGHSKGLLIILTVGLSQVTTSLSSSFDNFYIQNFGGYLEGTNSILILLILILIIDFADYLVHIIQHFSPFFWEFHECHHSATQMTLLNKHRDVVLNVLSFGVLIPLNTFISLFVVHYVNIEGFLLPIYILGLYNAMTTLSNYLGHTSTKITYPRFTSWFFMSPSLHWLHHSKNPKHFDKNFGTLLSFWDILFGTYLSEKHIKDIPGYGIDNSEYEKYHPVFSATILPVRKTYRLIKSAFSKGQINTIFFRS